MALDNNNINCRALSLGQVVHEHITTMLEFIALYIIHQSHKLITKGNEFYLGQIDNGNFQNSDCGQCMTKLRGFDHLYDM